MLWAGMIFAGAAALVHVYIFVLESLRWTAPSTRRTFGVRSEADAQTMRALAFNQGFYNLFLAVLVVVGIVCVIANVTTVGLTLVFAGTGMMLGAALVLVLSDGRMLRASAVQGTLPLLAVCALVLALIM
ncbi:DUF1304 domain-containing protein [Microbacterium keratanolyticum]